MHRLMSERIINFLLRCGFVDTLTTEKVVHLQIRIRGDSYYDYDTHREMRRIRRPEGMSCKRGQQIVSSVMAAFRLADSAPNDEIFQTSQDLLEAVRRAAEHSRSAVRPELGVLLRAQGYWTDL